LRHPLLRPIRKVVVLVNHLWGRISTQKRLLLLGLVSISALITFTAWVLVNHAHHVKQKSVDEFGIAVARALARGGAESLSNGDQLEGFKYYIMTEMAQTPAITYVVFCDRNGNTLLDSSAITPSQHTDEPLYRIWEQHKELSNREKPGVYESPQPGYRDIVNIVVPMRKNGEHLGVCWVGLDSSAFTIFGTPHETKVFLISIFGLVWFLGALCLAVNYSLINRPLKALSGGASQIAAGRFGHQIPGQSAGREIDQVVSAFNYMSKRLQQYDKQNVDTLMAERNKYISERNKLELVLMSIADGVVVCDRDNKVQIVNAAATQLFDKEAKDMLGKPLVFCTDGPDSPQICQVIQVFADTVSPGSLGPVVQQIALGERTVRLHIAPISLNKEFLGSVMIMHDITKQAELERLKGEFISNVSHELRTPITSIKSYVDTLCTHGEKLDPDIYREFLQIIDSEAERLMNLVNEVLELSKLEEGDREIEMVQQDVRPAVEYTTRAVQMMAKDRGVDLVYKASEELPLVRMNRESIERAVINLITNGIKYTPTGGKIEVSIDHVSEQNQVVISVKDNGIGIPEESLPHIFDRFYRVEKKVHTIKGTGLGLTIVKRIIEKHGGNIAVVSEIGHGSTFTISLPEAAGSDDDVNLDGQDHIEVGEFAGTGNGVSVITVRVQEKDQATTGESTEETVAPGGHTLIST
jgi:two-component system, OmpR family, sensor histidine kinase NblS